MWFRKSVTPYLPYSLHITTRHIQKHAEEEEEEEGSSPSDKGSAGLASHRTAGTAAALRRRRSSGGLSTLTASLDDLEEVANGGLVRAVMTPETIFSGDGRLLRSTTFDAVGRTPRCLERCGSSAFRTTNVVLTSRRLCVVDMLRQMLVLVIFL